VKEIFRGGVGVLRVNGWTREEVLEAFTRGMYALVIRCVRRIAVRVLSGADPCSVLDYVFSKGEVKDEDEEEEREESKGKDSVCGEDEELAGKTEEVVEEGEEDDQDADTAFLAPNDDAHDSMYSTYVEYVGPVIKHIVESKKSLR